MALASTFLVQVAGSLVAEENSRSLGGLEEVVRNPQDYRLGQYWVVEGTD